MTKEKVEKEKVLTIEAESLLKQTGGSKYVKSIVKKLRCSGTKKQEIKKWLESDISAAIEGGESMESIRERMGTPENAAKEFNDNFPPEELKAAGRNKKIKIAVIIVLVLAVLAAFVYWLLPKVSAEITHFDEEKVKERVELIIDLLDEDDYEEIKKYSIEAMKADGVEKSIREIKALFGSDWGKRKSFGAMYMVELTQMGQRMVTVQVNASYENTSVTYTVTLTEDLQLGGLYMK